MAESVLYQIVPAGLANHWTFRAANGWSSPVPDGYRSRELAVEAICTLATDRGMEARMIRDNKSQVIAVEVRPRVSYTAESGDASDRIRNIFVRKLQEIATERAIAEGRTVVTDDDVFESVLAASEAMVRLAKTSKGGR